MNNNIRHLHYLLLKLETRLPTKFCLELGAVNSISQIVTSTIGNVGYQIHIGISFNSFTSFRSFTSLLYSLLFLKPDLMSHYILVYTKPLFSFSLTNQIQINE